MLANPRGASISVGPGTVAAFVAVLTWLEKIVRTLVANNLCRAQDADARVAAWFQELVTGDANRHFASILRDEERVASTGPGRDSVVFRVLDQFAHLYQTSGLNLDLRAAKDRMAWEHKESVADKKTLFDAFFDLEEQAALATQGLAISQRVEHRAGWDVKFALCRNIGLRGSLSLLRTILTSSILKPMLGRSYDVVSRSKSLVGASTKCLVWRSSTLKNWLRSSQRFMAQVQAPACWELSPTPVAGAAARSATSVTSALCRRRMLKLREAR
jgi:hypothetical protein